MATKKAQKAKSRGRVKNMSTKSLTVREARTVRGGETPTTPPVTTPTRPFAKIKITDVL